METSSAIHKRIHNTSGTFESLIDALSISVQRVTHVLLDRIEGGLDRKYPWLLEMLKIT